MSVGDVLWNISLMFLCYAYVLLVILVSGRLDGFNVSVKTSRKFLHAMIGNLPFVIPFFTSNIYPALVAAPFVLVTFFVSPYSPFPSVSRKLAGLTGITERGHKLGLVYYAISYTVLASAFAAKPYIVAAGIMPMAYGDAAASLVGEKWGKRKYRILANKSLEGSAAMFLASLLSLGISLVFFSVLYSFSALDKIPTALALAIIATATECASPLGFDNLTVPLASALAFLVLSGGF